MVDCKNQKHDKEREIVGPERIEHGNIFELVQEPVDINGHYHDENDA